MARKILHVDLDAFFCSVEELLNPGLRGKAFVVGGSPEGRGVVASASYAARALGIRSAMPTAQALAKAPGLIVLSSRHDLYQEHSRKVMEFLRQSAPLMEQLSIDEAFLDLSDDPRPGAEIARALQAEIQRRFELPTSWGVASNKLVAKIAAQVGKPRGLIVVPEGQEAAFLRPLPVSMLWGVGPKTEQALAKVGVRTIGDLAALPTETLRRLLGDHGIELASRAKGVDERPVVAEHAARSMSAERTFPKDVGDEEELLRTLLRLSERVGRRLRKAGLAGRTIRIKLRWPDFTTLTRQTRLEQPTNRDRRIYEEAVRLLRGVWRKGRKIRLLGVGVADLGPPVHQLELFDRSWEKDERLMAALDQIRERFGPDAVRRASGLRNCPETGEGQEEGEPPKFGQANDPKAADRPGQEAGG